MAPMSSRILSVAIAAALAGLGVGLVLGQRSDPPPLPGPVLIDPVDSTTPASPDPTQGPRPQPSVAEPVPPRIIDGDDDDDDSDDEDDADNGDSDDD